MIIKFTNDTLNSFRNNEISFAFKVNNSVEEAFSFYYFRILILKENDNNFIYPLDSNIGNICLPKKDKNKKTEYYYCYALLYNNYNEFNLKFSVSTSNQKDNYNISVYKNFTKEENIFSKYYISEFEKVKDFQSILFIFKFQDNQTKTILSMFANDKDLNSHKFYSSQVYIISNSTREFNFNTNYGNCLLIFKFISGNGIISFGEYQKIEANSNYFGKPISFPLSEVKKIIFKSDESFIYHLKLKYIRSKSDIKELIFDESLNEILLDIHFPIYYYIKYNNQDKIDINFRIINLEDINTTTNILIDGYIINKDTLQRKLDGKDISLTESIAGQYDQTFKNGFLQINETIIKKYVNNVENNNENVKMEYILIKIDGEHYISNSLSVEIIAMF